MTLKQWLKNDWLKAETTSRQEILNLLSIVERDLVDATGEISADWQFGIAYNAALKLCSILLRAEGYRPARNLQHYRTIMALSLILGDERKEDADYLETCRKVRNTVEYDYAGGATLQDAADLLAFAKEFRETVLTWLKEQHPDLAP